ncbi:diacylglycerol kinase [Geotalea uraniireducens]|uniref:Diacylglycerol kinase n=1 Tax=Geotalea uraniireducens TaxID=351604 RepID=A0ABM8EJ23_9BACT|nr:diacylglycerol kinase family protein [Geotalea uraniireducens]BDV42254.1 diacylglycerol kinase [Geotalea uraniireducens]
MSRHCSLIINPVSGSYSARRAERIVAALRRGGLEPEILLTTGPDDAAAFAAAVCAREEEPLLVASGGDGTVNGVLNGMTPGKGTIAVLPLGTANVLALELGLRSVDDAVARIVRGESRPLTVGLLEGFGLRRYFSLMVGSGFDAQVVEGVRGEEKRRFGKGAYFLAAFRTLAAWDGQLLEVATAGASHQCHSVVICNAARYGGRPVLAPGASVFADGFQVVCIRGARRRNYLQLAWDVLRGNGPAGTNVSVFAADAVTIGGNKPVQADGDFICYGPVTVRSVPDFARIIA